MHTLEVCLTDFKENAFCREDPYVVGRSFLIVPSAAVRQGWIHRIAAQRSRVEQTRGCG